MDYLQPHSIDEVLLLLAQDDAGSQAVAGGTGIALALRGGSLRPRRLVSLANTDSNRLQLVEDGLHIGPMVRLQQVADSPLVRRNAPVLARACAQVGNVRVRNQATLAGNLAEADYATDPPAALLALEASVVAASTESRRTIPLDAFFGDAFETVLAPGELILDVVVPRLPAGAQSSYHKFQSRSSEERPLAGVAVVATFANGICSDLRVAVGAACRIPQRLPEVEQMATGRPLDERTIERVAQGYVEGIPTLDDVRGSGWYRSHIVGVLVRRALQEVENDRR